ncbi:MAG: beta strand repeat-containing protein, partial [Trebonia sp.]
MLLAPDTTGGTLTLTGGTILPFILTDGGILELGDANTGTVYINALGSISSTTADTLLLQTNTSSATAQVNETGSLGVGTLVVDTGGAFDIGGAVNAGSVNLVANTVTETSPGSLVGAGTLSGLVTNGLMLNNGSNNVADIESLSAGTLALDDGANALAVTGSVNADSIDLIANALSETGVGSIVGGGTLTGSIANLATLAGGNTIGTLGDFIAGTLVLANSGTLDISGTVSATASASITTGGSLTIPGTIASPLITLQGSGIDTTGTVIAGTLTGTATAGSAQFTGSNMISTLGAFSADGLTLDDAANLSVSGTVNGGTSAVVLNDGTFNLTLATASEVQAGSVTLIGEALALDGAVNAGSIDLVGTTSVTEATTASLAGTLSGTGATLTGAVGTLAALQGENTIAVLGDFSAGTLQLNDPGSALKIAGVVNAGSIDFQGSSVAEVSGGTLAGVVTLTGSLSQDAAFGNANTVGTLGAFTAGGNFELDDGEGLTVAGVVSAGTGDSLTLRTDSLTLSGGGSLVANNGTVAIAPETAGAAMTVGSALGGSIDTGTSGTLALGTTLTGDITLNSLGSVAATLALYT